MKNNTYNTQNNQSFVKDETTIWFVNNHIIEIEVIVIVVVLSVLFVYLFKDEIKEHIWTHTDAYVNIIEKTIPSIAGISSISGKSVKSVTEKENPISSIEDISVTEKDIPSLKTYLMKILEYSSEFY